MHRTRVKFCGITSVADAIAAADCGADAVGMVLHADSRRRIDTATALAIVRSLPPLVTPVGLFVDASYGVMTQTVTALGLRHLQLHGNESPELLSQLREHAVIKALRVKRDSFAADLAIWNGAENLTGVLLETCSTSQAGGSGIENDWDTIARAANAGELAGRRIILAGGLRPDNVGEIVRRIRPWAVDVSSGIESSPGVKSTDKMRAFAAAVREADSL